MRFERFFEDYVTASQTANSVEELKMVFERSASEEGYENHVLASVGERRLTSVSWFKLPDGYADAYIAMGGNVSTRCCPRRVGRLMRSAGPMYCAV